MKINCTHGFFTFEETRAGELADWEQLYSAKLARYGSLFTFADLELAPNYSLKGGALLDVVATQTFEGPPGEVFRANKVVYNFDTGLVVPISSITRVVSLGATQNYFIAGGLMLPGSLTATGERVTDYVAWYSTDTQKFRYSEVIRA